MLLLFAVFLKSLPVTFPLPSSASESPAGRRSQPTPGDHCPLATTDAQGGEPQFPFSSSCRSAEGASSEDLAEAGGVRRAWCAGSLITAAHAESLVPLHTSVCDWGSQQWPWGDKPSPGAAYSTRLAIPSHQEAGISECLHFQTVTHFS